MNGSGGRTTLLCGISIVEAEKDNQMYFDYMGKDYWKQLPSGHSQQQGGNSGVRQESPRQQEKPDVILGRIDALESEISAALAEFRAKFL